MFVEVAQPQAGNYDDNRDKYDCFQWPVATVMVNSKKSFQKVHSRTRFQSARTIAFCGAPTMLDLGPRGSGYRTMS